MLSIAFWRMRWENHSACPWVLFMWEVGGGIFLPTPYGLWIYKEVLRSIRCWAFLHGGGRCSRPSPNNLIYWSRPLCDVKLVHLIIYLYGSSDLYWFLIWAIQKYWTKNLKTNNGPRWKKLAQTMLLAHYKPAWHYIVVYFKWHACVWCLLDISLFDDMFLVVPRISFCYHKW